LTGPASSPDVEEFVRGKGLPVTDVVFGKDGAMYFTIGGRATQAGLYRVSWAGPPVEAPTPAPLAGKTASDDRFARFQARIALESAPDRSWVAKVLAETNPRSAITGLLALARTGTKEDQKPLLDALGKLKVDAADEERCSDWLRALEVTLARQGRPDADSCRSVDRKALRRLSRWNLRSEPRIGPGAGLPWRPGRGGEVAGPHGAQ